MIRPLPEGFVKLTVVVPIPSTAVTLVGASGTL